MKYTLILIVTILFTNRSIAQWTKINSIPEQAMSALASMNDTLYAASGANKVYKSVNAGESWSELSVSSQPISIFTLKIIDNNIYIGTTDHGIFVSKDFGATWTHSNISLQWVSGFEKFNNHIYASTSGSGVFKYDPANNNWTPFNNDLPVGWGYSVETIVTTSTKLLIGAGGNGTYFHYDFNADKWLYGYYYGQNTPGLVIQKIINQSDILFAVDRRRILRSDDEGENWHEDQIGSRNGAARLIYSGSASMYTVTNLLGGDAWIQKRNKNSASGTSWETDEELFTTQYVYDIFELHNKLFLATHNGVYVKDFVLGIEHPNSPTFNLQIFPNPSNGTTINVTCDKSIESYTITNSLGQNILSQKINKTEFTIDQDLSSGIYYVSVHLLNGGILVKKLVVN